MSAKKFKAIRGWLTSKEIMRKEPYRAKRNLILYSLTWVLVASRMVITGNDSFAAELMLLTYISQLLVIWLRY